MLRSLANMGIRGLGLLARFSLALYIAKYLSLSAVGAFGLVTAPSPFSPQHSASASTFAFVGS